MSTSRRRFRQILQRVQSLAAQAIPRRFRTAIFYRLIGVADGRTVLSGNFSG